MTETLKIEAVLSCPKCKVDKFEITRVPCDAEGVFRHGLRPLTEQTVSQTNRCIDCDVPLVRKNG